MKQLVFYGHSDDSFICLINGSRGEQATLNNNETAEFKVWCGLEDELIVRAQYVTGGVYAIGIHQTDEGKLLPNWPISIRNGHEYSPELVIDAPDDVQIDIIPSREVALP